MNTIIKENCITFKELEKNIFQKICQIGRDITKEVLESYDRSLMVSRDTKIYRNKGMRKTTIKTVYGEVTYRRNVYEVRSGDHTEKYAYLLDEALQLENTGLISANLAEQLVSGITEMSYRECAKKISSMTGQSISTMGVWNVIQSLGEKVCKEETELVKDYQTGKLRGTEEAPALFEEADGVFVNLQGEDRKRTGQKHAEIKVGIAYDGWEKTGRDSYRLDGIVVAAGFSKAKEFQEYREAVIAEKYNLDETEVRILNADGSSWIIGCRRN